MARAPATLPIMTRSSKDLWNPSSQPARLLDQRGFPVVRWPHENFRTPSHLPASPPDEPDILTYFVRSASLDEAKAKLKAFGGGNIQLIRELSEEEARELRYFS